MKTPREILLARHQAVKPRLDAVREAVIAGQPAQSPTVQPQSRSLLTVFGELLRIPRPAWAGLAAAWLVIIVLNVASRDTAAAAPAAPRPMAQNRKETLQQLREQKRLFAELVGALKEPEAESPRFVPRPRGELKPQLHFA